MLRLLKPYGDPELERSLVGDIVEVHSINGYVEDRHALMDELAQADLLMGDVDVAVTEEILSAAPKLRAVICRSIGVDFVDLAAASQRDILVLNSPLFCVTAVAEYALTLMLCLAHRIPQAACVMYKGEWNERENLRGTELTGKILGLVGYGRIGHELARMAHGIGMRVLAYDPFFTGNAYNVEIRPLKDVLENADVLSVHTPLTPSTFGMIGREQLRWMKPQAILINVSRGGIVEEEALMDALVSGRLLAAALDVFAREPVQPIDPFYRVKQSNILLTPHVAWNTYESYQRNQRIFLAQIQSLSEGELPKDGIVNPEVGNRWLKRWHNI